jgi:uncharacterized protein YcfL
MNVHVVHQFLGVFCSVNSTSGLAIGCHKHQAFIFASHQQSTFETHLLILGVEVSKNLSYFHLPTDLLFINGQHCKHLQVKVIGT